MLPNLSVFWVILFVLVLTFVIERLLLRPVMSVIRAREQAIASARELAQRSASEAQAATAETRVQVLHEDDSIRVLHRAVHHPVRGAVNVAGPGSISLNAAIRRASTHGWTMPPTAAAHSRRLSRSTPATGRSSCRCGTAIFRAKDFCASTP